MVERMKRMRWSLFNYGVSGYEKGNGVQQFSA